MDMLAYMLGKQAGGGGGGGDYIALPILDDELVNAMWGPSATWAGTSAVEFSMDWGDSGEMTSFYGTPGHTITVTVKENVDYLSVIALSDYIRENWDNELVHDENVSQGATYTFTMPYDAVTFYAGA